MASATPTYALRLRGLTLDPMPEERPGQRTAHSRRAYVLAVLIRDGGSYTFRENAPGDGTGVEIGRLRFVVELDAVEFWRKWAEVAGAKGWTY